MILHLRDTVKLSVADLKQQKGSSVKLKWEQVRSDPALFYLPQQTLSSAELDASFPRSSLKIIEHRQGTRSQNKLSRLRSIHRFPTVLMSGVCEGRGKNLQPVVDEAVHHGSNTPLGPVLI